MSSSNDWFGLIRWIIKINMRVSWGTEKNKKWWGPGYRVIHNTKLSLLFLPPWLQARGLYILKSSLLAPQRSQYTIRYHGCHDIILRVCKILLWTTCVILRMSISYSMRLPGLLRDVGKVQRGFHNVSVLSFHLWCSLEKEHSLKGKRRSWKSWPHMNTYGNLSPLLH